MKISSSFSLFRASCRIRTNDPEITNHVLWPTELKRRGWVSLLYRAATTNYLCCDQALEDSSGAGRIGLTHFCFASAKVDIIFKTTILSNTFFLILAEKIHFHPINYRTDSRKRSTFVHLLIKNDEL